MFYVNEHITKLLDLRAELVEKRRVSARENNMADFRHAAGLIDVIDQSIIDEKRLAKLMD